MSAPFSFGIGRRASGRQRRLGANREGLTKYLGSQPARIQRQRPRLPIAVTMGRRFANWSGPGTGGQAIIYTRGGDLDNFGESPDIGSVTEELKTTVVADYFYLQLDQKAPRQLAEGHSAAASPRVNLVAYISKRNIWSLSLTERTSPPRSWRQRGKADPFSWSPDGSKLVFANGRRYYSFVGVYDRAQRL